MKQQHIATLALLAILGLSACFRQPKPVKFTESWPSQTLPYEESVDNWTRRGVLRASYADQGSQLLELYATFLSTEWRAAYSDRQAELQKFSAKSRQEFEEQQRQQSKAHHQVELIISTYHPKHNDLHRDRSIWRVVLVDEQGNEILAQSIEKDRRPRQLIAAEFNKLGDFSEAYIATFPHDPKLLAGKKFSLRISCSLGTVEVEWLAE